MDLKNWKIILVGLQNKAIWISVPIRNQEIVAEKAKSIWIDVFYNLNA